MSESPEKPKRTISWRRYFALAAALTILLWFSWLAFFFWETYHYQQEVGSEIRESLDFEHGSPYVQCGSRSREVFTLHPEQGGRLASAGIRDGDIVVSHQITDFYRMIDHSRGKEASFTVVKGGDGPPLDERSQRVVRVLVPE